MFTQPLYLLQNHSMDAAVGWDFDDFIIHYDYHMRVIRASWLKKKFGNIKIPKDLFGTIVDADVTPVVLDRWYRQGGLNCVYYRCKLTFNGGDLDVDGYGIRAVQEEIGRRQ